ncbi:MAG: agmatine deiminase family protein [Candidatus Omnitrophica bacterium]|nr:agmatine deiminase family protein [Candidatus Omnitrophota bacterium]
MPIGGSPTDCRMPAEWEPHAATWLSWPWNRTTWPGRLLGRVESIYLQMILALLPGESVNLLVSGADVRRFILKKLHCGERLLGNLVFHEVKTVDAWIRDYGPIFVKKRSKVEGRRSKGGSVGFTKWVFNAWGGKYGDLARDNGVVDRIKALKRYERFDTGVVLEGGSIDVNGRGACLTTEQCLLNGNRNSKLPKAKIRKYLEKYLGVRKVIWLKKGIEGDDTDGHVDDIARFAGPRTVLAAVEEDKRDPNYGALKENLEILKSETDEAGSPLKVVALPMPGRVSVRKGERLPASYANFYVGNKVVLVPVYGHKNDPLALKVIRRVFPGRAVVGIECTALVHGLGSIHCVTQQEPG